MTDEKPPDHFNGKVWISQLCRIFKIPNQDRVREIWVELEPDEHPVVTVFRYHSTNDDGLPIRDVYRNDDGFASDRTVSFISRWTNDHSVAFVSAILGYRVYGTMGVTIEATVNGVSILKFEKLGHEEEVDRLAAFTHP